VQILLLMPDEIKAVATPVWDGRMDHALRAPPISLGHSFPADVRMCTTGSFSRP